MYILLRRTKHEDKKKTFKGILKLCQQKENKKWPKAHALMGQCMQNLDIIKYLQFAVVNSRIFLSNICQTFCTTKEKKKCHHRHLLENEIPSTVHGQSERAVSALRVISSAGRAVTGAQVGSVCMEGLVALAVHPHGRG